jgi:hypothetical protein
MLTGTGHTLSVAFCNGEVASFGLATSDADRVRLCTLLDGLRQLGKVAAWCAAPPADALSFGQMVDALAQRFGRMVVDAVLAAPEMRPEPQPAWLLPVGAFDHTVGPAPAASARLFGLDLVTVALPSASEERGVRLPDRDGLWLVYVLPSYAGE